MLGVMGLVVVKKTNERPLPLAGATAPRPTPSPTPSARPAPNPRTLTALQRLDKSIRAAERKMPALRHAERGGEFESLRVELLAQVSEARDELGTYLDSHPSDDRASRLWDRVLRAYVALKKL